ncbi:imidazolonepropionase [Legionella septentrionalis]|nr:imidazolonepropionase [Legionella septentrionalis]
MVINMPCDQLLLNATLLDKYGLQHANHSIAIQGGTIMWVGDSGDLPPEYLQADVVEDCHNKLITPAFIDCHTHLVYAGNRADEFKKRLEGMSYAEIARNGGGILSTVRQTRAVSEEELFLQSLPRLLALRAQGVLTVEIKSGYGLDLQTEFKMLRVARELGKKAEVRVKTTFLGAHAIPPEYAGRNQAYVDYLCSEMLPQIVESGLVDAVDVFCESIGFTLTQTEQIFSRAQELGLPVKCHAEQLSNIGASFLAAKYAALSCDHLEYLDEKGAMALAEAKTVAVLLPGAYYFLREKNKPPVEVLRAAGVGIAIATDCNPGSSPTTSLLLMLNMACQLFSLTVPETLSAVTYQAARALGIERNVGSLEAGKTADLIRWSISDAAELCYQFGFTFAHETMLAGKWKSF